MSGREKEIAEVAARLDALLDQLEASVKALNAVLGQPHDPPDDGTREKVSAT